MTSAVVVTTVIGGLLIGFRSLMLSKTSGGDPFAVWFYFILGGWFGYAAVKTAVLWFGGM